MELLRVTWSSFHSLATKYARHTLTTSLRPGRGFSQSMRKTPMLHWSTIMADKLNACGTSNPNWNPLSRKCHIHKYLQCKSADQQVPYELFYIRLRQRDGYFGLLLVCDEPVQSGQEQNRRNDIGKQVGGINDQPHQCGQLNRAFSWSAVPDPRPEDAIQARKRAQYA